MSDQLIIVEIIDENVDSGVMGSYFSLFFASFAFLLVYSCIIFLSPFLFVFALTRSTLSIFILFY